MEKSIGKIALNSPDTTPPENASAVDQYSARLTPPSKISEENPDENRRRVDISDKESDLVNFRPTAEFETTIEPEQDGGSGNVLTIGTGSMLSFDITSTQLGGAPINEYELLIQSYSVGAGDPWDPVTRVLNEPADSDITLFGSGRNNSGSYTFEDRGYYRAKLTVRDENGKVDTQVRRVLVTGRGGSSPVIDGPVSLDPSSPELIFRADAESADSDGDIEPPEAQLVYLWGVAPADLVAPDASDGQFSPTDPPPLRDGDGEKPWIFRTTPPEPGQYRVWLRVIDPRNGETVLVSDDFEVRPATDVDGDGKREDITGDGTADETDVSALEENIDANRIEANPSKFDFNDDGVVDEEDVEKLFREIDDSE
jgi:hypothetical protein